MREKRPLRSLSSVLIGLPAFVLVVGTGSIRSSETLPAAAAPVKAPEHAYVGSQKCRACHFKEWTSWGATKMANVFELLKPGARVEAKKRAGLDPQKDYTTDANCLPCHTIGYGKPGGFVDIKTTPDRAGVGCEMCHGPGGTYTQTGYMTLTNKEYRRADLVAAGLVGEVTAAQCVTCHNADSPFLDEGMIFDFEAQKVRGTHQAYPLKYEH